MLASEDRDPAHRAPPLRVVTTSADPRAAIEIDRDRLLGWIGWGRGQAPAIDAPGALLTLGDATDGHGGVEWWMGSSAIARGSHGDVSWAHDAQIAFATVRVDIEAHLSVAVEHAYRSLFSYLDTTEFRHIWRLWNFIPQIHDASGGLERYRQFNQARQREFDAYVRPSTYGAPAASALGSPHGPLMIQLLASKTPATALENPRQVSAYHYPAMYGPSAPTFSRAALASIGEHELLFVSGTASIVGHTSVHPGDVRAQTLETITNLEAIADQANRTARQRRFRVEDFNGRVYVRHRKDVDLVRETIVNRLGVGALNPHFLIADICRQELLVEIEAFA